MIYQADIFQVTELKQGKADLILTEPMWEMDYWDTWTEVVRFADRVLNDDGWLITPSAAEYTPYHLQMMMRGTENSDMEYRLMMIRWGRDEGRTVYTPEYLFSKGKRTLWPASVEVVQHQSGPRDENFFNYIRGFCPEGGLVADPFLGEGGIRKMTEQLGYRYEGFDIDPQWIPDA